MAVLMTFVGGWGHAEPLLPLARLARRHGHEVTFAGQAAVVPRLAELGFATLVVGPDTLSSRRRPLVPVDRAMERVVVRDHFIGEFADLRARRLGEVMATDRPAVVVCDEMDAGAIVAAESAGIPCVTVAVLAAGRLCARDVIAPAWDRLRAEHRLVEDPDGARFAGTARVTPIPASLRDPTVVAPFDLHHVRPAILDEVTPRPGVRAGRDIVYATLGTVFDVECGDLFARLVGALSLLDVDSLLTIGPHVGRDELPSAPSRVRIESFVPQRDVLHRCRAVVGHGGTGTVVAALSLGVPLVVLPMGADQPDNAARCTELGTGIVLDAVSAEPTEIAAAISAVLNDDRYAVAAGRIAAEAAAQPRLHSVPDIVDVF